MVVKKVAVGTLNPVKIEAVKRAFEKVWAGQKWQVVEVAVVSGVADQPMSDVESIRGARNRAKRAMGQLEADFGVGLEGGLQKVGRQWFECGWAVVVSQDGREGVGSSIRLETPKKVMKMIRSGKELGDVTDLLFGQTNSKQGGGYFGIMTSSAITRTEGYIDGVIAALARFIQPQIF